MTSAMHEKPSVILTAVDIQCTISAMEKPGGVLAPYFASRVAEAETNLAELAEVALVHQLQLVFKTLKTFLPELRPVHKMCKLTACGNLV